MSNSERRGSQDLQTILSVELSPFDLSRALSIKLKSPSIMSVAFKSGESTSRLLRDSTKLDTDSLVRLLLV